jgi:hypothetical protein
MNTQNTMETTPTSTHTQLGDNTMSNNIHLSEIAKMPLNQLAHLPAEVLMNLQQQVKTLGTQLTKNKAHLNKSLHLKYDHQFTELREDEDKPFGVMHLDDNTVDVASDAKKKVDWDQAMLAKLYQRKNIGDFKPNELINVTYTVREAKFKEAPKTVQRMVNKARSAKVNGNIITLTSQPENKA